MDFYIRIIKDGNRTGWLLGKKRNQQQPITWELFLNQDYAFVLNGSILEMCQNVVRYLRPTADERSILNLLSNCAEYVSQIGHSCLQIPLKEGYKKTNGAYRDVIPRLFERDRSKTVSMLRQFIESYDTFKNSVLCKPHNKDFLIVKAKELRVIDIRKTASILPLQYITEVLKIGPEYNNRTSKWFRKTGPIAIDFNKGKVCRRTSKVEKLIELVMANPFSLLIGEAATGKTVLVRDLAYTLYKEKEEKQNIYHYKYTDFDVIQLVKIIDTIEGIIILEDMHLNIPKLQQLYYLLKPNQNRQLLFVLRGGLDEFQDLINYEDLRTLPQMLLNPFEDVDKIIKDFCNYHKVPSIVWKKHEQIKEVSEKDFWLLAFALEGCAAKEGKGEPIEWLKEGVEDYLKSLKNCGDKYRLKYPKILLALSPLYMHELFTDEKYLEKLGYTKDELEALCIRGEIIIQKEGKDVYYGLSHSSLAKAYWQYGNTEPLEVKDITQFLTDYIVSESCNSLDTLNMMNIKYKDYVDYSKITADMLSRLIYSCSSLEAISEWILSDLYSLYDYEIVKAAVGSRINNTNEINWISRLFYDAERKSTLLSSDIVGCCGMKEMALKISSCHDVCQGALLMGSLFPIYKRLNNNLINNIDWHMIKSNINNVEDFYDLACCLKICEETDNALLEQYAGVILKWLSETKKKISFRGVKKFIEASRKLQQKYFSQFVQIANILENITNDKSLGVDELIESVIALIGMHPEKEEEILKKVSPEYISRKFTECSSSQQILESFKYICEVDAKWMFRIYSNVETSHIIKEAVGQVDLLETLSFFTSIVKYDHTIATILINELSLENWVAKFNIDCVEVILMSLTIFNQLNLNLCNKVWKYLNCSNLASHISSCDPKAIAAIMAEFRKELPEQYHELMQCIPENEKKTELIYEVSIAYSKLK